MKYLLAIILTLTIIAAPLNARNNQAVAGAALAGIALIGILDAEDKGELLDYRNFEIGKKTYSQPANSIINEKFDAYLSKAVVYTGGIINAETYKLHLVKGKKTNAYASDGGYKIHFATSILSSMEEVSGKEPIEYQLTINTKGIVTEIDSGFSNMVGKKIFEIVDVISIDKNTFSKEIIYTGVFNNQLHLQYREFKGDMIRSPFTLNLVFDLNLSNIITIQNYEIEIFEANNNHIVYQVL